MLAQVQLLDEMDEQMWTLLQRNLGGVTEAEAYWRPVTEANHVRWIVGHLAWFEEWAHDALAQEGRYCIDRDPAAYLDGTIPDMLARFAVARERYRARLRTLEQTDLDRELSYFGRYTVTGLELLKTHALCAGVTAHTISHVIPARNECALLPRLLDSVHVARSRYTHGPNAIDIMLADNGSTDGTAEMAAQFGCRVVPVEPRVIAAVRDGGALVARGSALAFVDADMQLHPDTFNAIAAALQQPATIGGASGIRPERWSAGIAAAYAVTSVNALLTGVDAGLVYCRRADFEAIGGYDERRASLEDVNFL